jgi:hypothetical protein
MTMTKCATRLVNQENELPEGSNAPLEENTRSKP